MDGTNGTPQKSGNDPWPRLLTALALNGSVCEACRIAGVGRTTFYHRRNENESFAQLVREALDEATDALEREARRRGKEGVDKPVIYQGELCGVWVNVDGESVPKDTPGAKLIPLTIREYSDTLLIFLLKGLKPEKYRERFEHTGKDGQPIQLEAQVNVKVDPITEARRLAASLRPGGAGDGSGTTGHNGTAKPLDP